MSEHIPWAYAGGITNAWPHLIVGSAHFWQWKRPLGNYIDNYIVYVSDQKLLTFAINPKLLPADIIDLLEIEYEYIPKAEVTWDLP